MLLFMHAQNCHNFFIKKTFTREIIKSNPSLQQMERLVLFHKNTYKLYKNVTTFIKNKRETAWQ